MPNETMVDKSFSEGRFLFSFIEVVLAEKYDDWSFYRNQFSNVCGGAKGVDFVCVVGSQLWLIESKDYSAVPRLKPTELPDEVAMKVRDTLAGLFSASKNATSLEEKAAAKKALRCNKIRVALHLEQPATVSRLRPSPINRSDVLQKLKQKLKAVDAHPLVFDRQNAPLAGTMTIVRN